MELAGQAGSYEAAALESLLASVPPLQALPPLVVPGVPAQTEVDRLLSSYERWVYVDAGAGERSGGDGLVHAAVEVLA